MKRNCSVPLSNVHRLVFVDACFSESLSSIDGLLPYCNLMPDGYVLTVPKNVQLCLFEEHINKENDATSVKHVTQIILEQNARLDLYKLQHQNSQTIHTAQTIVHQQRDSCFNSYTVTLGASLSQDDLNVSLEGVNASCALYGLYLGEDKQRQEHRTCIDHRVPHGNSTEYYKGILTGHATGVFNGKVVVHPDAQKTHSQQTNKNLLLSRTAQANAKPELEIYADDVVCAHGATVGQVDLDALFYLRSRGLDEMEALSLLAHAFADDVLEKFKHPEILAYIKAAVHAKMTDAFMRGE